MRLIQYFQKWWQKKCCCSELREANYKITVAGDEACLSSIRQNFYNELKQKQIHHITQIKSFAADSQGVAHLHIFFKCKTFDLPHVLLNKITAKIAHQSGVMHVRCSSLQNTSIRDSQLSMGSHTL